MAEAEGKLSFELVSPERVLVSRAIDMVVVPGEEGDFAALPGHAPFISQVRSGVVEIHDGGVVTDRVFVADGFAEVTPERCTVLAGEALELDRVDRDQATARLAAADVAINDARDDADRAKAEVQRAIAVALIEALDHFKSAA